MILKIVCGKKVSKIDKVLTDEVCPKLTFTCNQRVLETCCIVNIQKI